VELDCLPPVHPDFESRPSDRKNTEDKCWTQAGICQFNALRQAIITNRQAYPGFKVRWLRQARTEIKGLVDPDVDDNNEDNIVDADDNLFDSIASSQTQLTAAKQVHGMTEDSNDEDTDDDEEHCIPLDRIDISSS
jgi:hypothetical protein